MNRSQTSLFPDRFAITLLITSSILFMNAAILKGEIYPNIDPGSSTESDARFTDFIVGTVEQIGVGTVTVEGTKYILSPETVFMTLDKKFLPEDGIKIGDPIRVIFSPTENNMALKIELQQGRDEGIDTTLSTTSPPATRKSENIIFKNGVYVNDPKE